MKKFFQFSLIASFAFFAACSSQNNESSETGNGEEAPESMLKTSDYDPHRGEGKWTAENMNLGASLDAAMAANGEKISEVKCFTCHKLTDERLVGPGWKGVTSRNKPEWIMNFISNPDPMIDKDPKLQAQLELCLVRMPNQSLTDEDARAIVEFMRKNDGVQ